MNLNSSTIHTYYAAHSILNYYACMIHILC